MCLLMFMFITVINVHEVLQRLHDNCHAYPIKELTILYSEQSLHNVQ